MARTQSVTLVKPAVMAALNAVEHRVRPMPCRQCGGELLARCPVCAARFSSAFAVDCEACGAPLRPPEQIGVPIRRR